MIYDQQQSMRRDDDGYVVPSGRSFQTIDNSLPPKASPLLITSSVTEINIPAKAAEMVIVFCDGDISFSEYPSMLSYFTLAMGTGEVLHVATMRKLYITRASGSDSLLHFYYRMI